MDGEERVGNSERDAAVGALRIHRLDGRLEPNEFEERSMRARQARTWADLDALFGDLPEPHPRPGGVPTSPGTLAEPPPAPGPVLSSPSGLSAGSGGGLVPEPYAWMAMAIIPIAALVLFFATHTWLWFLLIPVAGVLIYGPDGKHGRNRNRNRWRDR